MPKVRQKIRRKVAPSPKLHLKKRVVLRHHKTISTLDVRCRALVDCMDLAAWMGDEEERTIYANKKFCNLVGYTLKEMIGRSSYDFCTLESAEIIKENNKKFRKKGMSSSYEIELLTKSGKTIPVRLNGTPLPDGGTVGIMEDLRELKKKEEALQEKKAKFWELFNNMSNGVAVYEAVDNGNDFIFRDFNRAGELIDNVKKENLIGKSIFEIFPGIKKFGLFDVLQRVWRTGKPEYLPTNLYEDQRISGWRKNYVYKLPNGEIVSVFDDITKQKVAEDELKSSKKLFDDLVEGSPVAMLAINMDHKVIYWNKEMEKLTGIKASKMIGTSNQWKPFYRKKRKLILDRIIDGVSNKEIVKHYEETDEVEIETATKERGFIGSFCFTNVYGEKKWIRFIVRPLRDAHNRLVGGVIMNEDITESKKLSENLTNRMRELQVLYRISTDIRIVTPLKKVLKDIVKDLVLACDEVKPARARIIFDNKIYTNLKKDEKFLSKIEEPLRVDGRKRGSIELGYIEKISNEKSFLLKPEKKVLHIVAQTLSKHVRSREIMKRYQKLVNKSVVGIFIAQDDIFKYVNPKFARVFKFKEKEIIGLKYNDLIFECACYTKIKSNKKLNSVRCMAKGKQKNETLIDLEVYTQRIDYYGRSAILGTVKDITKVKQAEERQRNFNQELKSKIAEKTRDLEKANRRLRSLNELKDEFIAVTSHELRSPLTSIRGYLSFLVDEGIFNEISGNAKDYLRRIYDNVEVLNNLVNNILDVSRIEMDRFELHQIPNDIVSLIQNVIENLKFQTNEKGLKVNFVNRLEKDTFVLKFDEIRIRQVLRNILDNAIKYSLHGKQIQVELKIRGIGLQISIIDEGVGIPKSQIFEIFDKFKQAKNIQTHFKGGAGLGLFIAKKIVELHGGMIWAESEIHKGTTFRIQLPLD